MNRFQMEAIYEANGCVDYRLRNTDDLLKVHGIDFAKTKGFDELDEKNKLFFEQFIVNYFNAQGLDTKMTMLPKGIYFVEDADYLVKRTDDGDEYCEVVGGLVMKFMANGKMTKHKKWLDKDHKDSAFFLGKTKQYLRFEYRIHNRNEWQHIYSSTNWG